MKVENKKQVPQENRPRSIARLKKRMSLESVSGKFSMEKLGLVLTLVTCVAGIFAMPWLDRILQNWAKIEETQTKITAPPGHPTDPTATNLPSVAHQMGIPPHNNSFALSRSRPQLGLSFKRSAAELDYENLKSKLAEELPKCDDRDKQLIGMGLRQDFQVEKAIGDAKHLESQISSAVVSLNVTEVEEKNIELGAKIIDIEKRCNVAVGYRSY